VDKARLDELLGLARRRDPEALRELVAAYSARVFGLAYRLTGSRDAAEDIMQETFLRMVRGIEEYDHSGRFEAWLFRISANLARDRARQRGRRGEPCPLDEGIPLRARADVDPAAGLARRELGDKLAVSLARLPAADREVLLLRHYGELSFREIAELLGVPLGTALARAHRAMEKLRVELGEDESC
jgi:RNA polymerase sigma-70 factor (ECF subfamily)